MSALPTHAPTRRRMSSMDMDIHRIEQAKNTIRVRALEASSWIHSTLEIADPNVSGDADHRVEAFFDEIQNGVLLCQLINKIQSEVPCQFKPPKSESHSQSFVSRDNVTNFITAAKQLGVRSELCFEADDLITRKNDFAVVNGILALSRVASQKFNIRPPQMVQYEEEIDRLEKEAQAKLLKKEQNNGTQSTEEDEEEEEEVEEEMGSSSLPVSASHSPARSRSGSVSSSSAPIAITVNEPSGTLDENRLKHPSDSSSSSAVTSTSAALSASSAASTSSSSSSSTPSSPSLPPHPRGSVSGSSPGGGKRSSVFAGLPPTGNSARLLAKPAAANSKLSELDSAIAKALAQARLNVTVRAVVIKNKKQARAAVKKGAGQYRFGNGPKVFVRVVQNQVMVRSNGQWEDLAAHALAHNPDLKRSSA